MRRQSFPGRRRRDSGSSRRKNRQVWSKQVADQQVRLLYRHSPAGGGRQGYGGLFRRRDGNPRFRRSVPSRNRRRNVENLPSRSRRARQRDLAERRAVEKRRRLRLGLRQLRPTANLAFWGVGNGGPWMGDQRAGDNLLYFVHHRADVATGKIKGHHQYDPNESWDWDEVSPPLLIDYQRNGRTVKGLVDVARDGYLWFLERSDDPINFVRR